MPGGTCHAGYPGAGHSATLASLAPQHRPGAGRHSDAGGHTASMPGGIRGHEAGAWRQVPAAGGTATLKLGAGRKDSYDMHRAFCEALLEDPVINPAVRFTEMAAAAAGSGGRHGIYGGASSALTHNQFGNNSNTGFAPLDAGYNPNCSSSSQMFEDFVPQSTNPNHGPTNFPMQYPSNQELLARKNQNLMNQQSLINRNNNNNLFNPGYFQDNTENLSAQTVVPSLFNNADNNVPSALLGGSSVAANNFGGISNGKFQGQMNALAATSDHQGQPGSSIFNHRFGNNLSMGGTARQTLDFLGVNGNGGRGGPPLDVDMKFPDPNNPFGNV
ncbi:hypothetical protein Bca52824_006522 [Brassica carinata]|uniref:Uncharacterized protein n=1 Tax=Brassica carinata TaxID=52824 RepID=A0A8X7W643_BRACI|nr:hypothetical protein Bca52824_006522 [Brassica carinata]